MSKNTVTLLDRLFAIPVAIYFWWHEQRQKASRKVKKYSWSVTERTGDFS